MPLTRLQEAALAGDEAEWLRLRKEEHETYEIRKETYIEQDDFMEQTLYPGRYVDEPHGEWEKRYWIIVLSDYAESRGISLTDDQIAKIRAFVGENKIKEAQEEVIKALDKWFVTNDQCSHKNREWSRMVLDSNPPIKSWKCLVLGLRRIWEVE